MKRAGIVRSTSTGHAPETTGRILVLVTEDWFALSHFRPLIQTLTTLAREVVVATRSSGRLDEIRALGVRVIPFDLERARLNPLRQAGVALRLGRLIRTERPDVVHVVAMQPMVIAALALEFVRPRPKVVMHLTGLGFLGISPSPAARIIRPIGMRALDRALRRPDSHLLTENPEDAADLAASGVGFGDRVTILGGAGLDPALFPALPPPANPVPVAAFVGRMIRPKGVTHLVAAKALLDRRGVPLSLRLYGKADRDNPEAIAASELEAWSRRPGVTWAGHVDDISEVWRGADIAVLPAITREGLPRSLLEAAASARPLIVTDVPGCRHFVRNGIDGLIVPPEDPTALADALAVLASDVDRRHRMGLAARERLLSGFTVEHVTAGIRSAYTRLATTGTETRGSIRR